MGPKFQILKLANLLITNYIQERIQQQKQKIPRPMFSVSSKHFYHREVNKETKYQ